MQIVAYDFGCKNNILRRLASFGCKVTVVPADYPAQKVMELNPDGIFLSNGPVNPPPASAEAHNGCAKFTVLGLCPGAHLKDHLRADRYWTE